MNRLPSSNLDLLIQLLGARGAKRLYRGALSSLFQPDTTPSRYHRRLTAARELVRRWLDEELKQGQVLSQPNVVREYLRLCFVGQDHESFIVLFLDTQNQLIAAEEMFRGSLSQTSVYPREIVRRALQVNAAGVIFAHNHPSGLAEPSRADELLTQFLKQAPSLVGVRMLDHFVVGGNCCAQLCRAGDGVMRQGATQRWVASFSLNR